jgi:hypothetical protein
MRGIHYTCKPATHVVGSERRKITRSDIVKVGVFVQQKSPDEYLEERYGGGTRVIYYNEFPVNLVEIKCIEDRILERLKSSRFELWNGKREHFIVSRFRKEEFLSIVKSMLCEYREELISRVEKIIASGISKADLIEANKEEDAIWRELLKTNSKEHRDLWYEALGKTSKLRSDLELVKLYQANSACV